MSLGVGPKPARRSRWLILTASEESSSGSVACELCAAGVVVDQERADARARHAQRRSSRSRADQQRAPRDRPGWRPPAGLCWWRRRRDGHRGRVTSRRGHRVGGQRRGPRARRVTPHRGDGDRLAAPRVEGGAARPCRLRPCVIPWRAALWLAWIRLVEVAGHCAFLLFLAGVHSWRLKSRLAACRHKARLRGLPQVAPTRAADRSLWQLTLLLR